MDAGPRTPSTDAPQPRAQVTDPTVGRTTEARTEPCAPRGLDDLYDIGRLAERLGVEHATIRVWLSRKVPWLPAPDGRLNGGAVWRASTLEGIEERRHRGRPGRKPRVVPPAASADVPRTGAIPVIPAVLMPDAAGRTDPVGAGPISAGPVSAPAG